MACRNWDVPVNNEWRPFIDPYASALSGRRGPYEHDLIDIRQGLEGEITTIDPRRLHPARNVYGWYWRPSIFGDPGKPGSTLPSPPARRGRRLAG